MTRSIGPGAVILLMGCSTAPVSFHGVAPPGKDNAYDCAVAQLNILGYTIEDGNKPTGFVRGRKQTSGLGTQLLTGNTYNDILTVTAFDNPGTGETNLRVVASRVADHDISIFGGLSDEQPAEGVETIAPSDSGKADARVLLAGCGVNNVVGPPQDQEQFVLEGVV